MNRGRKHVNTNTNPQKQANWSKIGGRNLYQEEQKTSSRVQSKQGARNDIFGQSCEPDHYRTTNQDFYRDPKRGNSMMPHKPTAHFSQPETRTNASRSRIETIKSPLFPCYKLPNLYSEVSNILRNIQKPRLSLENVLRGIQTLAGMSTRAREVNVSLLRTYFNSSRDQAPILEVIHFILSLVEQTPTIFSDSRKLKILRQGHYDAVTLTRKECACLLANMFMCVTINQGNPKLQRDFNFSGLYQPSGDKKRDQVKIEKIACIFNYFKKICRNMPSGEVSFTRLVLDDRIQGKCDINTWRNCNLPVMKPELGLANKIELVRDSLEVDFANKYLGGGVLGGGSVQEEIQFITRPEQIVGMLFCECLNSTEAIRIKGAKVYSNYYGYASTFQSGGPVGETWDREVVAIDAIDFKSMPASYQYNEQSFLRDLNKAYVGFWGASKHISTGGWGCGIFAGNLELKFIIQVAAASRAGRRMVFNSQELTKSAYFSKILSYYDTKPVGQLIGDTLSCLEQYSRSVKKADLFKDLVSLKMNRRMY